MAATVVAEAPALDELRFVLLGVFAKIEQLEQPAATTLHTLYSLCITNWKME